MGRISIILFCVLLAGVLADGAGGSAQQHQHRNAGDPDAWEALWNQRQPAEAVLDTIGVMPGMTVGEIGAGRGRYAVHVARRVGQEGLVYANDIDEEKLSYLRHRCERDTIGNITTILGTVTEPRFPEAALDLIYVINSYHHFEDPAQLLSNTRSALKADGHLVIIEHDPDKKPSMGHATPKDSVQAHATRAGYELEKMATFLEYDTIYIFVMTTGGNPANTD